MKAKLITLLFLLVVSLSFYGQEPTQKVEQIVQPKADSITTKRNEPLKVFLVDGNGKMVEETTSWKDWIGIIVSIVTLIISLFALRQIYFAKKAINQGSEALKLSTEALKQNVSERNLQYLSEMDKMMVDYPDLWAFYDLYSQDIYDSIADEKDKKKLRLQIKAFIYYKLNNFEVALLEQSYYHDDYTLNAWREYFSYCLERSSEFEKIVKRIVVLEAGYRGIFKKNFEEELLKLYNKTFPDREEEVNRLREENKF